jgi:hypothetical protein
MVLYVPRKCGFLYFPRPRDGDPLFESFASRYIAASSENALKLLPLAELFIEGIKVEQAKNVVQRTFPSR